MIARYESLYLYIGDLHDSDRYPKTQ